jgi:16S rRNA (cytosine967-C5)-methyltransferase
VQGDFPEWLSASLQSVFGDDLAAEMAAMASRAPVDLRVNSLKALRPKLVDMLAHLGVETAPIAPFGLRIRPSAEGKAPSLQSEPAFLKGLIEIQDEGSQIVAALSGAKPGEQVLDLCAGGGGKTLALAAMMNNRGQLYAADSDKRRLAPIHERIERAGVRNVQVRTPRGSAMMLDDLTGRMDLVLIDAPCTGTGTWRRNPDAKWRIRPGSLEERLKEQSEILENAASYLKPGGRLVYITCSILNEENDDQIEKLLAREPALAIVAIDPVAANIGLTEKNSRKTSYGILLTPHRTATDGFYCAMVHRKG